MPEAKGVATHAQRADSRGRLPAVQQLQAASAAVAGISRIVRSAMRAQASRQTPVVAGDEARLLAKAPPQLRALPARDTLLQGRPQLAAESLDGVATALGLELRVRARGPEYLLSTLRKQQVGLLHSEVLL
jgi:hypothetical protein